MKLAKVLPQTPSGLAGSPFGAPRQGSRMLAAPQGMQPLGSGRGHAPRGATVPSAAALRHHQLTPHSLERLKQVARGDGDEAALAAALWSAMHAGTLKPARSDPVFVRYAARLTLPDGRTGAALMALRKDETGGLKFHEAGMRLHIDGSQIRFRMASAQRPPSNPAPAHKPHVAHRVPAASQPAVDPVETTGAPALSAVHARNMDRIVAGLLSWDRTAACLTIEQTVRGLRVSQRDLALRTPNAKLAGMAHADMPDAVQRWAASTAAGSLVPDTRGPAQKTVHELVDGAMADPAFEGCVDRIAALFSVTDRRKLRIRSRCIKSGGSMESELFRKVFADPRPHQRVVDEILVMLLSCETSPERVAALRNWKPTNPSTAPDV